MSKNPYSVLDISPRAGEEEIKKRYRYLVKQYHPDLHPDDPDAARKMSEINAAYEQIKEDMANGGMLYGGSFNSESFTGQDGEEEFAGSFFMGADFGTAASQMSEDVLYDKVHRYITEGLLSSAVSLLNRIVIRTGKWYYYAACVSEAKGDKAAAVRYADIALQFDPSDPDYANLAASCHKKYDAALNLKKAASVFMTVLTFLLVGLYVVWILLDMFGDMIWGGG